MGPGAARRVRIQGWLLEGHGPASGLIPAPIRAQSCQSAVIAARSELLPAADENDACLSRAPANIARARTGVSARPFARPRPPPRPRAPRGPALPPPPAPI